MQALKELMWNFRRSKLTADKRDVHKPRASDVVITPPLKVGEKVFQARIVQPPKSHFLSWPRSLGHVEGMLMLEAFQQVVKAARKKYCNDQRRGYYFTGIQNFKIHKPLPLGTEAKVRVEFLSEFDYGGKTHFKIKGTILDAKGNGVAEAIGTGAVYELKNVKI